MFSEGEGYIFQYKGSRKECDGELNFRRHTFTFRSKRNQTYIVEVDEFDVFLLYIVKFYLKSHRLSERKFQIMTGLNETAGLITTCINIMIDFYTKNPYRSFGFIVMNGEGENTHETKRFRVYKAIMARIFKPVHFIHFEHLPKSAYLMLNREFASTNLNLLADIETFFNKHYDLG